MGLVDNSRRLDYLRAFSKADCCPVTRSVVIITINSCLVFRLSWVAILIDVALLVILGIECVSHVY